MKKRKTYKQKSIKENTDLMLNIRKYKMKQEKKNGDGRKKFQTCMFIILMLSSHHLQSTELKKTNQT